MEPELNRLAAVTCKLAVIAVCLAFIFDGSHPPMHAQPTKPVTFEDEKQDDHLGRIEEHLKATDVRVDSQSERIQTLAVAQGEMQGENRIWFIILGALTGGSIVFQRKSQHGAQQQSPIPPTS